MYKNINIKIKSFISEQVIFRFLSNLQRLNKIIKCKKYKSEIYLKLNKRINKTAIESNTKIFVIYN